MTDTLLLTVGGSPEPIVTALRQLRPRKAVYLATAQSRAVVEGQPAGQSTYVHNGQSHPTILAQTDRDLDTDELVVLSGETVDDFASVYERVCEAIDDAVDDRGSVERVAVDFTGGTKSMSAGAVLAAVDRGVSSFVVTGPRTDARAVRQGQVVQALSDAQVREQRYLTGALPSLLKEYRYAGARSQLDGLMARQPLPPESRQRLQALAAYLKALDAWDRFDHEQAAAFADTVGSLLGPLIPQLKSINRGLEMLRAGQQPDGNRDTEAAYAPAQDLLRNAERRRSQGRFDDAVGRLYRTIEATAQARLLVAFGWSTAALPTKELLARLPGQSATQILGGDADAAPATLEIGLLRAYEILAALDDPLGKHYVELRPRLRDALQTRNHSLLAHGFSPSSESGAERLHDLATSLLRDELARQRIREHAQLPSNMALERGSKGDLQQLLQGSAED